MEDKQIIDLYQSRSESAVSETKTKYGSYIFSIAINLLSSTPDAEECENDTYLSAWNSIPPQVPLNLKIFLGRITKNHALDMYRKNTAKKRGSGLELILSELSECATENVSVKDTPETEMDAKELTKHINAFLHALPKEKRIIFIKRYWYGESIDEISENTGLTTPKITTTLFRLRQDLKSTLEKEGVTV